jgi:hypothetical protein
MALKALLDKIDDLPEDVKKEYKKGDDGKFHLDVDGIDDHPAVKGLKNAMTNAKAERGTAQQQLTQAQADLQKVRDQLDEIHRGAVPKGDVAQLEKSWQDKLVARETELTGKITKLTAAVDKNVRQATAAQLAADLFVNPALGLPHVLPRLKVEEDGDNYVVKILDANGAPSASSMDDFKKELLQNKDLAPILRGTRASGGGANGGGSGGGAPSDDKDFDATKATPKDLAARITARKQAEGG